MKKEINIGDAVDTGQGDYLRLAGSKINDNFEDIYNELGDNQVLFSAGAWKIKDKSSLVNGILDVKFGQSLILNTTGTNFKVHLPKGGAGNIGKVIKLRDVYGTWFSRPVQIRPFSGDTIKGKTGYTTINRNFANIELVYTSKSRWEFVETTQIDKHSIDEAGSVVTSDFIAFEGQTDFPDPFTAERFNPLGIEVYRRGNKLYYGKEFSEASEYGSIGTNGALIPLDGNTIKLRHPCKLGDTVSFTSYLDGIEIFRTSKVKRVFRMRDSRMIQMGEYDEEVAPNNDYIFDINKYQEDVNDDGEVFKYLPIKLTDLNIQSYDNLNPYTIDVLLNGTMLTRLEDYGGGEYYCDMPEGGDAYDSPYTCEVNGGVWKTNTRTADYNFTFSGSSIDGIEFNIDFKDDDILTLIWYNNIIGSTLSVDEIQVELDKSFVNSNSEYYVQNTIQIPSYQQTSSLPNQSAVIYHTEEEIIRPSNVNDIMNLVYPIGHVYMNYYNKFSPEVTLGFGIWRRLSGHVVAGFTDDYSDTVYGQNNNHKDVNGNPTPTPGGTYGTPSHRLNASNFPYQEFSDDVLVVDNDGDVDIGACLIDPEDEGLASPRKYSEQKIGVGTKGTVAQISNLQPTVIVSMWVRVA